MTTDQTANQSPSSLRVRHPRFFYRSFSWQITGRGLEMSFEFELDPGISFRPQLTLLGVDEAGAARLPKEELDNLVFHIGLAEMPSYWKAAAPPEIIIEAGPLSIPQLDWWHDLLIKGMGEFFFVNGIDFTQKDYLALRCTAPGSATPSPLPEPETAASNEAAAVLIPLGGGKDSVVTLEVFKDLANRDRTGQTKMACFYINPTQAARDIAAQSGTEVFEADRQLDPKIFDFNNQGYLNGHVPISALFAFVSLLAARIFGYQYVAVSNERSSNEGNAWFHGQEINHQHSKTFEFEQKFQDYVKAHFRPNSPLYFSFLRPLYELQIAGIFAKMTSYHHIFRSCNRGQKTNSWCGQCPKCLFAFTILFPYLGEEKLVSIFGKNLFEDADLLPIALELTGVGHTKPFECVGTHEENLVAFYLSIRRFRQRAQPLPVLLKLVDQQVISTHANMENRTSVLLSTWTESHAIPDAVWAEYLRSLAADAVTAVKPQPSEEWIPQEL